MTNTSNSKLPVFISLTLALLLFGGASSALAGGTRIWELAGFNELDKGELDNTAVSSRGEVTVGVQSRKLDVPPVGLVWSAAESKKGTIYLGTGYDGKIYRVTGDKAVEIATTGQLVVTDMVLDDKGDLYAATLPEATIWKISDPAGVKGTKPVKASAWSKLPKSAKHVWALEFSADKKTLYAGTGPEGQIFAVGKDGKANVYVDTEEDHILSLLTGKKDVVLAGTSPGAMLLQATGPGRVTALADFDATEVKAIAKDGDDLILAVNKFSSPPTIPTKASFLSTISKAKGSKKTSRSKTPRMGDGFLYRLLPTGQTEKLWSRTKAHVVSLAVDSGHTVYAGLAADGKIISVDTDRLVRTELDLDEREVMVILADKKISFAATGDAGAAYRLDRARNSEAFYLAPPLDAGTTARWGRLQWFASGTVTLQARSGNTLNPDKSWTPWSKKLASGKVLPAKPGRYLQIRVSWARSAEAVFRSLELAYAPLNRRAIITDLNPDSPFHSTGSKSKKSTTKRGKTTVSKRTVSARPSGSNKKELSLSWKVDNPDSDTLRYKLFYRATGEELWRPILRDDEILTKTRYKWDTESVPEGRYTIRLVADDSPGNSPGDTLSDEYVSVPVLVDNHQPRVGKLTYKNGVLKGDARDTFSAISVLDYSIDGGPWMPFSCADDIFDEPVEEFSLKLPVELSPGPHALAVRAYDRAGNMGSNELHVQVKK